MTLKLKVIAMVAALAVLSQVPLPAHAFGSKKKAAAEAVKTEEKAAAAADADASDYISPRVRALDTNKDGKITQEEFLKDHLAQFNRMDADQDKILTPDEVDFPPGTPDNVKMMMRKRMQEDEARDAQRRVEEEKRRAEEMQKREAEMQTRRLEEEKAAKEAPAGRVETEAESAPAPAKAEKP